jgi:putative sigma-54 modulation protein
MRLNIHSSKVGVSEDLREYVERRAGFALAKFGHRVRTVSVTVKDANGPKGGVDKQCRVTVELVPSGTVSIEERQADFPTAIAHAMDRVGRSVGRTLERWRNARTSGPSMGSAETEHPSLETES